MNPGATTRPSASIVRLAAAPAYLPTPTIFPPCTATSAANAGSPEPSTTRPFLISRSYAILFSPLAPAPSEPATCLPGENPTLRGDERQHILPERNSGMRPRSPSPRLQGGEG